MNRLELLAETLRAALNELAAVAPEWLRGVAPAAWYERYCRRIEDSRLPQSKAEREAYARGGRRGRLPLLDRLEAPEAPAELRDAAAGRGAPPGLGAALRARRRPAGGEAGGRVRLRPEGELPPAAEGIESPYDPEARYRSKSGTALDRLRRGPDRDVRRGPPPPDHARGDDHRRGARGQLHGADPAGAGRAGPAAGRAPGRRRVRRPPSCWSAAGRSTASGWSARRGRTRAGRTGPRGPTASRTSRSTGSASRSAARRAGSSASWKEYTDPGGARTCRSGSATSDCRDCPVRSRCTRAAKQGRYLRLPPREQYEALREMRSFIDERGGPAAVRAASGDRGDDLAGGAVVRAAAGAVPRRGEGAPAARGDGGGDELQPGLGLAGGRAARGDADVAVRAAGGLTGIRQQYRALWDANKPGVVACII